MTEAYPTDLHELQVVRQQHRVELDQAYVDYVVHCQRLHQQLRLARSGGADVDGALADADRSLDTYLTVEEDLKVINARIASRLQELDGARQARVAARAGAEG